MLCGFPAGSGADMFVRYFAEKLRRAGGTVIVENKVGRTNMGRLDRGRGPSRTAICSILLRYHRRGEHAPVQEPAVRRRQGHPVRRPPFGNQAFMLAVDAQEPDHEGALIVMMKYKDKASFVSVELEGLGGSTTRTRPGCRRLRCSIAVLLDLLVMAPSGRLDHGLHDPIFALGQQQRQGRLRILAVSTGKRLQQSQPDISTSTERHPDGSVAGDPDRHAAADHRQDQPVVQRDRQHRGDQKFLAGMLVPTSTSTPCWSARPRCSRSLLHEVSTSARFIPATATRAFISRHRNRAATIGTLHFGTCW